MISSSTLRRRPVAARRAAERELAHVARPVRRIDLHGARLVVGHCDAVAQLPHVYSLGCVPWACYAMGDEALWQLARVEGALDLTGFAPVPPSAALRRGDLVVYYDVALVARHVAVGRGAGLVESKFGPHGGVYLHAVDTAPSGHYCVVYRGGRPRRMSPHE